jgi:hypothetical protein
LQQVVDTMQQCQRLELVVQDDGAAAEAMEELSPPLNNPYLLTSSFRDVRWLDKHLMFKSLYIRKCFQDISALIINSKCARCLVSGTPGIGKSTFLSFFVYELMQLQLKNVIVKAESFSIVVDFGDVFGRIETTMLDKIPRVLCDVDIRSVSAFESCLNKTTNYYLFDAREGATPLDVLAKSVVASSPNRNNYKEFDKRHPIKYYMPAWSYDELLVLREHCFSTIQEQELEERYIHYGGIPRDCFVGMFSKHDWKSIIDGCDPGSVMNMVGRATVADSDSNVLNHRLVHLVPNEDYLSVTLKFGSQLICDAFFVAYHDRVKDSFVCFINTKKDAIHAGLRGQFFEPYAHRMISEGGTFKIRSLGAKNQTAGDRLTLQEYEEVRIENESNQGVTFSGPSSSSSSSSSLSASDRKYFIPFKRNYAAVDSFSSDGLLFQMTVSENHPIKRHLLKTLLKALDGGPVNTKEQKIKKTQTNVLPHLYFVVPADKFDVFKRQNYVGTHGKILEDQTPLVEQFALCISMANDDSTKRKRDV